MAEGFPEWAVEEVNNVEWQYYETRRNSGYILDFDRSGKRVDVQFYDKLPDGRHIATLDVPEDRILDQLETDVIYIFDFKVFRAQLSAKFSEFLDKEYSVNMDYIYRFELIKFEKIE